MQKRSLWPIWLALLTLTFNLFPLKGVFAEPLVQDAIPTAAEVIEAVNTLRIANGLLPLNAHPVLMQVAQWEANAIAGGAPGHTRPAGLTLGQWLISLGYPLSGDLSLDGYRSENWVTASTAQEAIEAWLGDDVHTNTMLSPYRSDIGAGIAVGDQIYIVLETALQTVSGEMQTDAFNILTAIPQGRSSNDTNNLVPQYIIPVKRSTARPDGNVIHKVQYGQSLWSIAITYNTTIDQIRAWNNLGESIQIYDGQVLLVQMGATQPPPPTMTPPVSPTAFHTATRAESGVRSTGTVPPGLPDAGKIQDDPPPPSSPGAWAGLIVMVALVAGLVGAWVTHARTLR